jgi:hypothetical protein
MQTAGIDDSEDPTDANLYADTASISSQHLSDSDPHTPLLFFFSYCVRNIQLIEAIFL